MSDVDLRQVASRYLAAVFCAKMGHQWEDERIQRVAEDAVEAMEEGIPTGWAFAAAYNTELLMYGDGSITSPIGILNTH